VLNKRLANSISVIAYCCSPLLCKISFIGIFDACGSNVLSLYAMPLAKQIILALEF